MSEARSNPEPSAGVYVHIPFCRHRCHFCPFLVTVHRDLEEEWFAAVLAEIAGRAPDWRIPFDSVFFGGGTPSYVPPDKIGTIVARLADHLDLAPDTEVELEANPEDLDPERLAGLKAAGVTRLSIGVQSFDDEDLSFLTRQHSAAGAVAAVENARRAGFDHLSIDLLYGLPGRSRDHWQAQIDRAAELGVDHVSAYLLAIEPGTPFHAMARRGRLQPLPEDEEGDLLLFTLARLSAAGFLPYEISNFAVAPEFRSRHNRKYWEGAPYLGLGPAAHGFRGNTRAWNVPGVKAYVERHRRGELPTERTEVLDPEERRLERSFLGLRTTQGIELDEVTLESRSDLIEKLETEGLAHREGSRLRLTHRGWPLADAIARGLAG